MAAVAEAATPPAEAPAGRPRVVVRKDKTNPRRLAYLLLLLFAAPPGWPLLVLGAALVLAGVWFHGWAAGLLARAGYVERTPVLTVRGPYRHNRNPYYAAHLMMDAGFFCLAGRPLLYLVYFPVIFSVYRRWVLSEEPFLKEEFGAAYADFMREVPRWRIRITPGPARGPEQRFSWTTFRQNRELARAGAHLALMGVFLAYAVFGSPFAGVSPLVLATWAGAVAAWLLLHDVLAVATERLSPAWLLVALGGAAGGGYFLATAPLWTPWPEAWAWGGVAVGGALGLVVAATATPTAARVTGRTSEDLFARKSGVNRDELYPRPMLQYYLAWLGLGLLAGTLGGVWLAIAGSLVLWALGVAGLVQPRTLPQRWPVALAVLALYGAAVWMAAGRLLA